MTILKTDTVSGIGTEGTVFEGDITFDSLNYMTLPKGTTTQSNRGRALLMGNQSSAADGMKYFSLISSGNTILFGDLTGNDIIWGGAGASSTRGVIGGGSPVTNTMEYVTIATTGNSLNFGDTQVACCRSQTMYNSTRGVFSGGDGPSGSLSRIDYITIATTGNSQDFGEQQFGAGGQGFNGVSSAIRGVYGVTWNNPSAYNVLEFITIAQTGNGTDFGDLTVSGEGQAGCSNSHGGLQ